MWKLKQLVWHICFCFIAVVSSFFIKRPDTSARASLIVGRLRNVLTSELILMFNWQINREDKLQDWTSHNWRKGSVSIQLLCRSCVWVASKELPKWKITFSSPTQPPELLRTSPLQFNNNNTSLPTKRSLAVGLGSFYHYSSQLCI